MKKFCTVFMLCILLTSFFSCETIPEDTKNNDTAMRSDAEPEYTIESGDALDRLWAAYFQTKDDADLEKIIAYVNTNDMLTAKINEQYKKISRDKKYMTLLDKYGAEHKNKHITVPYDFEILSGILMGMNDQKLLDDVNYLYSFFNDDDDLKVRAIVKGGAFISLVANAKQHTDVNIALQKHIPYLNEKVQTSFYSDIGLNLKDDIGFAQSDNGTADFDNHNISIKVILVNDMQAMLHEWVNLKPEEAPNIISTSKVTMRENQIAPFIVFFLREQNEFPLYYDCELIYPDGTFSKNKGLRLSFLPNKPADLDYVYTANQPSGFAFDETDKAGTYTVRVSVYTDTQVIAVFENRFVLEK